MKIVEFMVGVKKGLVAIKSWEKKKYFFRCLSEWQNLALSGRSNQTSLQSNIQCVTW